MKNNKFHLEEDSGRAHISGALNEADETELLIGVIRSERKNLGIGTRLLRALESLGSSRGANKAKVVLGHYEDTDIDGLKRFYENHGYELSDDSEMTIGTKKL